MEGLTGSAVVSDRRFTFFVGSSNHIAIGSLGASCVTEILIRSIEGSREAKDSVISDYSGYFEISSSVYQAIPCQIL